MQQTTNNKQQTTKPKTAADKKILNGLKKITAEVGNLVEKYEFGHALHKLYDFFWHEYADVYIETAKHQMMDEKLKISTQNILLKINTNLLKLLHPFLPFITEEIWGILNNSDALRGRSPDRKRRGKLLLIEDWPC